MATQPNNLATGDTAPDTSSPVPARRLAVAASLVAVAGALALFHHRVIVRGIEIAVHDFGGDWSHTLAVPFIAAWLAFRRLEKPPAIAPAPAKRALPLLLAGIAAYQLALYPARNHAAQGVMGVFNLAVCVWFLAGTATLRRVTAPLALLLLAVRLPDPLMVPITQTLRHVSVHLGAVIVNLTLARSHVQGRMLVLHGRDGLVPIDVADACAGLRSLLAFVTLAAAFALANPRPAWHRLALIASAVPIAVVLNALRVAALALLHVHAPDLLHTLPHSAAAFALLPLALAALLVLDRALARLITQCVSDAACLNEPRPSGSGLGRVLFVADRSLTVAARQKSAFHTHGQASPAATSAVTPAVSLRRRAWLVAALFTLAAACQSAILGWSRVVLDKQPVALRAPLFTLPQRLGRFTAEGDETLPEATLESLGTRSYLLRTYRRDDLRAVRLHLAYYTGNPDTLPHVPDRCLVAAGAEPIDTRTIRVNDSLDATLLLYHPPTRPDLTAAAVYFFIANGRPVAEASRVRLIAFDPARRTSHHCKVELHLPDCADAKQAAALSRDFLADALPAITSLLPDDAR